MNRLGLISGLILTLAGALPAPGYPAAAAVVSPPDPGEVLQGVIVRNVVLLHQGKSAERRGRPMYGMSC